MVLYEVGATGSEEKELFNEIAAAKVTIPKVAGFSFSLPPSLWSKTTKGYRRLKSPIRCLPTWP